MVRLMTTHARVMVVGLGLGAASLFASGLVVQADQSVPETMTEFSFEHPDVTVQQGETAHFLLVNSGRFPHTMTIDDVAGAKTLAAPADALGAGESGTLDAVFSVPGKYDFWCPVGTHREQGMIGTITVVAPAVPTPAATRSVPPAPAPTPAVPSAPRARDGQSLDTQPAATRAAFIAVWGSSQAGAEWVKEHEAALSSQGR